MATDKTYYATGKRKNAIARTWITPGTGNITVNDRPADDYFTVGTARTILRQPLALTIEHHTGSKKGNFINLSIASPASPAFPEVPNTFLSPAAICIKTLLKTLQLGTVKDRYEFRRYSVSTPSSS